MHERKRFIKTAKTVVKLNQQYPIASTKHVSSIEMSLVLGKFARSFHGVNIIAPQQQTIRAWKLSVWPFLNRTYATQGSTSGGSRRKAVTVINDDGRIHWGDLSTREKAARTTQQSFNFLLVVAGIVMTVSRTDLRCVKSYLYRLGRCRDIFIS